MEGFPWDDLCKIFCGCQRIAKIPSGKEKKGKKEVYLYNAFIVATTLKALRRGSHSSLLIYRPRKDERLSWPSWLTYSGWLTHISGHPSATSRAQDSKRTPAKDRCSTAGPHNTTCGGSAACCKVYGRSVMSCAKLAEPIEMPFEMRSLVDQRNYVLDGVQMPHKKGHF